MCRQRLIVAVTVLCILIFIFIFLMKGVFATDSRMTVEANILAPVVSIQVPEYVFFGNLTKGFSSDRIRVDINNTGNTAVTVTPQLSDPQDKIFQQLQFARRTTEDYQSVSNFSIFLARPSAPGKIADEYFYMKLDLTDYEEDIRNDRIGQKSTVIFVAVPQ